MGVHVGAYKETGIWKWIQGNNVADGPYLWAPTEPNNLLIFEDCAMIEMTTGWGLVDILCASMKPFVCESYSIEMATPAPTP